MKFCYMEPIWTDLLQYCSKVKYVSKVQIYFFAYVIYFLQVESLPESS